MNRRCKWRKRLRHQLRRCPFRVRDSTLAIERFSYFVWLKRTDDTVRDQKGCEPGQVFIFMHDVHHGLAIQKEISADVNETSDPLRHSFCSFADHDTSHAVANEQYGFFLSIQEIAYGIHISLQRDI